MVKLAFYKAKGTWLDCLVRRWTRSQYSHVEIVFSDGIWFSASPRENEVRFKWIVPKPGHWDFVDICLFPTEEELLREYCEEQDGKRYDWIGIFLSQIIPLGVHNSRWWFCSEVVSAALQFIGRLAKMSPQCVSPGTLAKHYGLEA